MAPRYSVSRYRHFSTPADVYCHAERCQALESQEKYTAVDWWMKGAAFLTEYLPHLQSSLEKGEEVFGMHDMLTLALQVMSRLILPWIAFVNSIYYSAGDNDQVKPHRQTSIALANFGNALSSSLSLLLWSVAAFADTSPTETSSLSLGANVFLFVAFLANLAAEQINKYDQQDEKHDERCNMRCNLSP